MDLLLAMSKIHQLQLFTQGNLGMEILYQKVETPQSFLGITRNKIAKESRY